MAYEPNEFGYKDALPSGDPDKVIKGSDFDVEFNAIKEALDSVDVEVNVDDVNGLGPLLDGKADKSDLEQEIQDRKSEDATLQGNIDGVSANLSQEIQDRIDGDTTLGDRIDNLVTDDLADVNSAGAKADQFLIHNGSQWVAEDFHVETDLTFIAGISVSNEPAPTAEAGDIYLNNEEGIAGESWTGIAGKFVNVANAVGWSEARGRWYLLGDVFSDVYWQQNGDDIYYNDGNVGIGRSDPDEKLVVQGSMKIRGSNSLWFTNTSGLIGLSVPASNRIILQNDATDATVQIRTNGDERMRIDADGNVGIGTDNPRSLVHASKNVTDTYSASASSEPNVHLQITNNDTTTANTMSLIGFGSRGTTTTTSQWYIGNVGMNNAYANSSFIFGHRTAGSTWSEVMRLDGSGNVGIGEENPSRELHITNRGSGDVPAIRIEAEESNLWIRSAGSAGYFPGGNGEGGTQIFSTNSKNFHIGINSNAYGAECNLIFVNGRSYDERMRIDNDGRVGIGGQPSRSTKEIEDDAVSTLAGWKAQIDDRLKAEPKADKKAVTLEITGEDKLPTKAELIKSLTERNIGGGSAKLQVAGDGYFSGTVYANTCDASRFYKDGYGGISISTNQILPVGSSGNAVADNAVNIGRTNGRFKDAHFSGTIYGTVDDVPSHVKNITPTQIANWDAGTGGGGGGATTDGRISDTQITNWDHAYGWGNHATAGYQPAGSYADANHNHSGVYQPAGNYALVGASYTKAESDGKYELKGAGGLPAGDWACSGSITAVGNITAYASSDERLKDDITAMPVGLIDSINPVTWKWKESGKDSGGVVAQQLQECGLDDWVNEAPNGDLGVDYNALIGVLLAEVKDLKARVKELETK